MDIIQYNGEILKEYESLYADFPSEEIFPLANIQKAYENGQYKIIHLYKNNEKIGYAHFLITEKTVILSFLEIKKELRHQGLGHLFMQKLIAYFRQYDHMLLEVERETSETYKSGPSRMRFYEDLGFVRLSNVNYQIRKQGSNKYIDIHLYVLNMASSKKGPCSYEEVKSMVEGYYQTLFGKDFSNEYKLRNSCPTI